MTTREGYAGSQIRLAAARRPGWTLWRNNVGVLVDKTGRPVRYGLANETKEQNDALKSADYIGWRRVLITPDMVGKMLGQFVSVEAKRADWTPTLGDAHEDAQRAWAHLVNRDGGYAIFSTGDLPE